MVLKSARLEVWAIVVVFLLLAITSCTNALFEEAEAIRFEATAQTRIPVAPKTPTVSPIDGPEGSGKVKVTWEAVPGSTAYDVYYSSTVSPPALPNGGTDVTSLSWTIEALTNWETCYFWIIAKNKLGSSPLSIPPATGASGIAVTSISLNKTSATFLYGSKETITATITPSTATNPNVTWGTSNGTYATVSNGTVTGENATGSAFITATAADGQGASATFTATTKAIVINGVASGPAGGYLFYDSTEYGTKGWRFMEAATVNVGSSQYWGNGINIDITGATGHDYGTGRTNTTAIIEAQGPGTYMANTCRNYSYGGYSDWFMPSSGEAAEMLFRVTSINYSSLFLFVSSTQMAYNGCHAFKCDTATWITITKSYPGSTIVTRPIRQF